MLFFACPLSLSFDVSPFLRVLWQFDVPSLAIFFFCHMYHSGCCHNLGIFLPSPFSPVEAAFFYLLALGSVPWHHPLFFWGLRPRMSPLTGHPFPQTRDPTLVCPPPLCAFFSGNFPPHDCGASFFFYRSFFSPFILKGPFVNIALESTFSPPVSLFPMKRSRVFLKRQ